MNQQTHRLSGWLPSCSPVQKSAFAVRSHHPSPLPLHRLRPLPSSQLAPPGGPLSRLLPGLGDLVVEMPS